MTIGTSRIRLRTGFPGELRSRTPSPFRGAAPGNTARFPFGLSTRSNLPPRINQNPAGPAYTFTRVMPSAWS